jgi:hypothetical protein
VSFEKPGEYAEIDRQNNKWDEKDNCLTRAAVKVCQAFNTPGRRSANNYLAAALSQAQTYAVEKLLFDNIAVPSAYIKHKKAPSPEQRL